MRNNVEPVICQGAGQVLRLRHPICGSSCALAGNLISTPGYEKKKSIVFGDHLTTVSTALSSDDPAISEQGRGGGPTIFGYA
jgi:hypothetical protein